MITLKPNKKTDYKFIGCSIAVLVLVCIISVVSGKKDIDNIEIGDEYNARFSKLVISEVVSSNPGVYVNSHNETTDYLEIYNGKSTAIDLSGYGLSDREDKIKWRFPSIVIEPDSYLVVSLCGNESDGLNAPFKLSSKGSERLILTNAQSKIIDGVDTLPLSKGQCMYRDEDGNWQISEDLTPGFENSKRGLDAFHNSLFIKTDESLKINEFLPRNKGNYLNAQANNDGFIELINSGEEAIDLSSYYLSNDKTRPFKSRLSGILGPGEIRLLDLDGSLFDLRGGNGEITIAKNGSILDLIEYNNLTNGLSMFRDGNEYYVSAIISPGYSNDTAGIEEFQLAHLANRNGLIINEVMSSNDEFLPQNGHQFYDWVELYNNSDSDINLSEYSFTTSLDSSDPYRFKDVTIPAHGYYVFMCSGSINLSNDSYDHCDYKLSANESIYLLKNSEIADAMFIPEMPSGYSYGRDDTSGYFFIKTPSPGSINARGVRKITEKPSMSVSGGIYNDPLIVELSGRGEIHYTLDGTDPSLSSMVYSGEMINLDNTCVLKARSFVDGELASDLSYNSYIISENHTMPVLSVTLDSKDFSSLNNNAWSIGLKKQSYMELFEDGKRITAPCSISLFGGNARSQSKKAYCLRFDSMWGAKNLEYRLFKNRETAAYDSFVLRSGSSDWNLAIIRDIVGTSLIDDYTDIDVQAYKPVIVYINGNYWGIYNLREKVNSHFIEEHHNVSKDSISIFRIDGEVECGSKDQYDLLRAYCRSHDLRNDECYEYVKERINITNLIDYWIAEGFFTNNDLLNVRLFSSPEYDDGRFNYIFYDLDFAWYNPGSNWYTEYIGHAGGMTDHNYENDIIYALLKNSDFRSLWLERLNYHLHNTLAADTIIDRIDEITALYEPEIVRNQERWGLSAGTWRMEVDKLRDFARIRGRIYLSQTKSYFGLNDNEMKEIFGDLVQ